MFSSVVTEVLPAGADNFQGAGVWRIGDGIEIVSVFSGVVYVVNRKSGTLTYTSGPMMNADNQVFIEQAGDFLLIHEETSLLVLEWADGAPAVKMTSLTATSLLSDAWSTEMQAVSLHTAILNYITATDPEPTYDEARTAVLATLSTPAYPMGTVCCYAHGRTHLVCSTPGKRYFRSSDILISSDPESVLHWWEDSYLNSGGGMGLPDEMGYIRGMATMMNSDDTASGIGPMVVFAQDGVAAFSVNLPREGTYDLSISSADANLTTSTKLLTPGWKDRQISQVLYYGNGTESPWSLCRVNGDLMYRSADGLRSVRATVATSTGAVVANPNMSAEVDPFVKFDSGAAELDRVSAASAGGRVLCTASRTGTGYRGIISLDLAVLSLLDRTVDTTSDTKYIAYDGLWTGLTVGKLLRSGDEIVIVATDGRIYCVSDNQWDVVDGTRREIECQYVTKSLDMKMPGVKKQLSYVDVWLRDMLGGVSLTVYFRPDNFPWWTRMGGTVDIECPDSLPPQERRRLRFISNLTDKCSYDGTNLNEGESFQFLLIWNGQATVHRLTAAALPVTESPPLSTGCCDFANMERDETQIEQDDFSYPGS